MPMPVKRIMTNLHKKFGLLQPLLLALPFFLIHQSILQLDIGLEWSITESVRLKNHFQSTHEKIANTIHNIHSAPPRLLVYDPRTDSFLSFTIGELVKNSWFCGRCETILPLLVRALLEVRPNRFQPDQPPLQMLFWDSDFTYTHSLSKGTTNRTRGKKFAPILHFGSCLKHVPTLENIHSMPTPTFLPCLREWRLNQHNKTDGHCTAWQLPIPEKNFSWDELKPVVIWRGSNFQFLPGVKEEHVSEWFSANTEWPIIPRRIAVFMSKNQNGSWLDVEFIRKTGQNPRGEARIPPSNMSAYRYQIDLGGAGGTTWTGTLDKLSMPGLLFHHETPSKDWYFDKIVPWEHYVPVQMDLSNLKARYDWAESHREEAMAIAQRGTRFATDFFSYDNLQLQYEKYFGSKSVLGNIVDGYKPNSSEESVDTILSAYLGAGVDTHFISNCSKTHCTIRGRKSVIKTYALHSATCYVANELIGRPPTESQVAC